MQIYAEDQGVVSAKAMLPSLKWIGVYGNRALAFCAGLVAFGGMINGQFIPILIGLAVCGLAIYNIRVIRWAMGLNSEEESLQAEVRKAELRQHLAALGEYAHSSEASPVQHRPAATDPAI